MIDLTDYCLRIQKAKAKLTEFDVDKSQMPNFNIDSNNLSYYAIYVLSRYSEEYYNNPDSDLTQKIYDELSISSQYFDASEKTNDRVEYNWDFLLSAACSYFLSDDFGSCKVMLLKIRLKDIIDVYGQSIYIFLKYLLFQENILNTNVCNTLNSLFQLFPLYLEAKKNETTILEIACQIEQELKEINEPLSLYFGSIILAIIKKSINSSSIKLLPYYTGLDLSTWGKSLCKKFFPKLLWHAQRLIGESGILKGKSGVIQLPTGVGKTKSIELIIKSSFLGNRANVVVIIAPLRSLCNEISNDMQKAFGREAKVNKISDVLQQDFAFDFDVGNKNIVVCTPEKLNFLLYHTPSIINLIDLFIFDEGHLFDDRTRGTQYELLLTFINQSTNEETQKVLISAVIPNADDLKNWLTNSSGATVSSDSIKTTMKSNGFVSKNRDALLFFDKDFSVDYEFYLPRVIQVFKLRKLKGERIEKEFPNNNTNDYAIYLALKLRNKGPVAIYVSRVNTINTIISRIMEIYRHGYDAFADVSNESNEEKDKILFLISKHYGNDSEMYFGACLGFFPHYSNLENGLRLSIEYAIKKKDINTIICTSTLAQGVNLPIKYLLLTSVKENQTNMQTRTFQNLIGRTARSGMYSEGSIIITDPNLYDKRLDVIHGGKYRWQEISRMFDKNNSEKCASTLLKLVKNFEISYDLIIPNSEITSILLQNYSNTYDYEQLKEKISSKYDFKYHSAICNAIDEIKIIIEYIENYLSFLFVEDEKQNSEDFIFKICSSTFAYSIATIEEKNLLLQFFNLIFDQIKKYKNIEDLRKYSYAMINIKRGEIIKKWLEEKYDLLNSEDCSVYSVLLSLYQKVFGLKKDEMESFKLHTENWINGLTYCQMHELTNIRIPIIEKICSKDISYNFSFLLGNLIDIIKSYYENESLIDKLNFEQKRIKYGLSNIIETCLYEIGFADRLIVKELAQLFNNCSSKEEVELAIVEKYEDVKKILEHYPNYFIMKLNSLVEI